MRKVDLDPASVSRNLGKIQDVIRDAGGKKLASFYREAYEHKLEPPHVVEAGRGAKGHSDPTGGTITAQEGVRLAVEEAAESIEYAKVLIDKAAERMRWVFRGPHPSQQKRDYVSPDELKQAYAAKRKRELNEELAALEQRKVKIRRELG